MNYDLNTNTAGGLLEYGLPEYGLPDAEDAKVTQRTQKKTKKENVKSGKTLIQIGNAEKQILVFFSPLLRPLRNFCVLCVRKFSPSSLRAASPL